MADNEAGIEAGDAAEAVAGAFRDEWGRVVATLIGMTGDWDLAEECAQEAFAQALRDLAARRRAAQARRLAHHHGPQPGPGPAAPPRHRGRQAPGDAGPVAARGSGRRPPMTTSSGIADDRLRLIFTCCHPALPLEARVALTLRTLAGLTHGRDRAGVPGARADHGQAPGPGQAQDPRRRHPVPGAARAPAARADRRGAGRALPAVQRGLRGQLRAPTWSAGGCAPRPSGWPGCWPSSCPASPRPRACWP